MPFQAAAGGIPHSVISPFPKGLLQPSLSRSEPFLLLSPLDVLRKESLKIWGTEQVHRQLPPSRETPPPPQICPETVGV